MILQLFMQDFSFISIFSSIIYIGRDEQTPLLTVCAQLSSGLLAAEGLHADGHIQASRVPLEVRAGERTLIHTSSKSTERERKRVRYRIAVETKKCIFCFQL